MLYLAVDWYNLSKISECKDRKFRQKNDRDLQFDPSVIYDRRFRFDR